MTTPRSREASAARVASTPSGANATRTTDKLLRLFRKTLKDQTPQQRRLLAGDIALEIPVEAATQSHPEALWMLHLRTFVRRELDLDPPTWPAPASAVTSHEVRTINDRVAGLGEEIDETGQDHRLPLRNDREIAAGLGAHTSTQAASLERKGGRPAISPERARRLLLARVNHFRDARGPLEPLTNVALAKATRPIRNEDTIGNWLRRASWTLDDLEHEWERRGPKQPE